MQPLKAGERENGVDITLYDRFASTIFTYLYQQVSSQQDAEDLLLEIFTAALTNPRFLVSLKSDSLHGCDASLAIR